MVEEVTRVREVASSNLTFTKHINMIKNGENDRAARERLPSSNLTFTEHINMIQNGEK